ncbi:hypothetical protein GQ53DRAFT_660637 [Thozetella sp. PMI_491]|nr:hypothetical protein GQ53DRAFT_660637 [Thozetella sp. PMI_491]
MSHFNMQGGSGSADQESNAHLQSLLAQLRLRSETESPSPGDGGPGARPDMLSQFNSYHSNGGNQSYHTDSPNIGSAYDSPAFPPAAPTPPSFGQPQYLPSPLNPIGTSRDAPANDGRTASLLSLLKKTGPSGQYGTQQDPPISIPHNPIPHVIHAPAPAAPDPSGLLAVLMKGSLHTEARQEPESAPAPAPAPAPPSSTWNTTSPSSDTKQYLLNLLNRPKPSQAESLPEPEQPAVKSEKHGEVGHQSSSGPIEPHTMPTRSEFDFEAKAAENLAPKLEGSPHSQHSHAGSASKSIFNYSNPFNDFPGSSPIHRTPKSSTTPGASGSATVSSQTAATVQILKKPDSAQSHHEKRSLSERGSVDTPEHTRRKLEHIASPLSHHSANQTPRFDEPEKDKESVAEAMGELAQTAHREANEALARAEAEEAQAQEEIARNLDDMLHAKNDQEFGRSAHAAAQAIQHELEKEENMGLLESTLDPEVAKAVHEIVDEAAQQAPVADSWESAEADEIIVIEETTNPVKVYNLPMKPWIVILLRDVDEARAVFRPESILDIARLKKDFDQNDRNLVSASESYIAYGMSKAGGFRVLRQDDGKDAKLFTDTKDRIFNLSISTVPSGEHPNEAIIGTGVNGTVYWVQLREGDRDHLDDAHPEQYGFALPPLSTHEGDAPGGVLKTRARPSSMHPEFFAVGRGKSINIVWPSFIFENKLFKAGHDRVVDTETLLKKSSLKINTGKAGKDFTFSQDDTTLVSLDKSGRVKFWDVRDLTAGPDQPSKELKDALLTFTTTPDGEKAWPTSVLLLDKFRPYQKRTALRYMIVGMKQNHTLQLWDLALGKAVQEINFPHNKESDAVCSVMYHAPSSMIVVGHPTRNSIYFLHLSAPKYTLKSMSQVDYITRLAALDSIPQPESTAVISGIREYSFANKGTLRSLSILENPAMTADGEGDEPTLFELFAVHSKGVTCISVKQAELGWSADNKVMNPVDAVEVGYATTNKLPSAPSPYSTASAAGSALGGSTAGGGMADGGVPQIRIATRTAKDALHKSASSQGEDAKKAQDAAAVSKQADRKDDETPTHPPEKPEKKNRRKKGSAAQSSAAAAAASEIPTATTNGAADLADLSRSSSQNKPAGKGVNRSGDPSAHVPNSLDSAHDANLEAIMANMESRIVTNIAGRFDSVLQGIVGQLTELQNRRDSDFMNSQAGLLNMVADVLNKNTESVLKGIIVQQFQATTPDLVKSLDRSVSDHLGNKVNQSVQKELQKGLPNAISQGLQKSDLVRGVSDKVAHNLGNHVESQLAQAVNNYLPVFTNKAVQAIQQVGEDVGHQIGEGNRRVEQYRREQDSKIDKLIAQTSDLASLVSTVANTQSQLQSDLAVLKQQLLQDRSRERAHASPQASRSQAAVSQASPASHNAPSVPTSRELVGYGHPQESRVLYDPSTRESREKQELEELATSIESLMQAQKFDEAMLRWLQSEDQAEEIYNRVIAKYNPAFVAELQPLLLLSVGATVSMDLDSSQVAQKMSMVEMVIYNFHSQLNNLDDQVRDVTPRIMGLLKTRIEHLILKISRFAPNDSSLRGLTNMATVAGRIVDTVVNRGPRRSDAY